MWLLLIMSNIAMYVKSITATNDERGTSTQLTFYISYHTARPPAYTFFTFAAVFLLSRKKKKDPNFGAFLRLLFWLESRAYRGNRACDQQSCDSPKGRWR